jgi:hypothetical protein
MGTKPRAWVSSALGGAYIELMCSTYSLERASIGW